MLVDSGFCQKFRVKSTHKQTYEPYLSQVTEGGCPHLLNRGWGLSDWSDFFFGVAEEKRQHLYFSASGFFSLLVVIVRMPLLAVPCHNAFRLSPFAVTTTQ